MIEETEEDGEILAYITAEDPRYPTLTLQKHGGWVRGYALNPETGDLRRVCICAAHCRHDCICGAWDEESE